jgi:sortase (surface protein transpeptidase)
MKPFISLLVIILGMAGGVAAWRGIDTIRSTAEPIGTPRAEDIGTPAVSTIPRGDVLVENRDNRTPTEKPARLHIPSLNVSTQVEHVAEDKEGRMDVPDHWNNVAWYEPGYMPGMKGNAVIAGHYDTPEGKPSVFFRLPELRAGDEIELEGESGGMRTFIVERTETYPDEGFPIDTVFGPSDRVRLNLITCQGMFDTSAGNYSDRMVVFAIEKQTTGSKP